MSLAEQMLATMPLSDDSVTYLADEEPHIVINESRQAIVPNELKIIAVTGDKDIETVTFDCVRFWDGNDLSTFAIYLNYVLPDLSDGTYIPDSIVADGDVFHFDWNIKNNITKKNGKIAFAITAIKTKQNESGETVVDKQWGSLPNSDCSIALGLDISNVPAEEESNDVVAKLSAILEKIHSDLDEWIETVVVQTTGTSKTQVMSQEAVTISLNSYKAESIQQSNEYTNSKSNLLDKKILQNSNKISRDSKRITNLEQGIAPDPFETDKTVAYIKDVPVNALPYAEISKVGGMTYKDGGTLKSAKVTALESVGSNLLKYRKENSISQNGVTITISDDGILANGTPSATTNVEIFYGNLPKGTYTINGVSGASDSTYQISLVVNDSVLHYLRTENYTFTLTDTSIVRLFFYAYTGTQFNNKLIQYAINRGITALPYTPYRETVVLPIPSAVQSLDGYGDGINSDIYNYIDLEQQQFVKRVGVVDMGTLVWSVMSTDTNTFRASVTGLKEPTVATERGTGILTSKYPVSSNLNYTALDDKSMIRFQTNIILRDSSYTDAATLKTALKGVMLYYELATPDFIDISDVLPIDNFIEVEGGGTVTAVNEYGFAVPSEIVYQIKEATI
jgi:hypothetical protein